MKVRRLVAEEGGNGDAATLIVGMKLDSQSRELLTWALVKVANPGDRVVALHVLHNSEVLDQHGNSALLSLVKAFESVLAVYEGFCNLKQIDLKLKICRGSSVRKVLVSEAKSFGAAKVILGIRRNRHTIGSNLSVAKYCANKLPLNCSVLAVNNGKVTFQREIAEATPPSKGSRLNPESRQQPPKLLSMLQRTLSSKNPKLLNCGDSKKLLTLEKGRDERRSISWDGCQKHVTTGSSHSGRDAGNESLALVPVQNLEAASSSISLLMREFPDMSPGWPLLRRKFLPQRQTSAKNTVKKISVVQWAMRLPSRHSEGAVHPDLQTENQAIVPVGKVVSPEFKDAEMDNKLSKELESLSEKYLSTCRLFGYQELLSATSNFANANMIGKGGSSQVFKGQLPDGKEVAVKILKHSEDRLKEFVSEIEITTILHHKNIISLFGFSLDKNKLLLVYDLLPRGSLEETLNGKKSHNILCWDKRYRVAVGLAEALDYLHNHTAQCVIHRDVKSSNILLADDFEPQLSDFGLATFASTATSHIVCSDVAGTFGYLAPEYFMYGKVTEKIDVYAFGVVLLELLSGRKPISNDCPKGQESLVMWAKPILQSGKAVELLDPRLCDYYERDQAERVFMAASLCVRRSPRRRPNMNLILRLLQGDDEAVTWAESEVGSVCAKEESCGLDDESHSIPNIQSHLNVALLDLEDDSMSVSSVEPTLSCMTSNKSLEDYLQGRWSRCSSFN